MHGSRFQRRRERMNSTESSSSSDSSGNEKKYGTRAASTERRQKTSQESAVTIELSEDGLSPEAARAKKAARHNRELLRGAIERRQFGERYTAKSTENEDLEMEKQASKKGDKSASPQTKEAILAYFGFAIIITLCLGLICFISYNHFKHPTTKQEIAEAERLINHIERDHLKNDKKNYVSENKQLRETIKVLQENNNIRQAEVQNLLQELQNEKEKYEKNLIEKEIEYKKQIRDAYDQSITQIEKTLK